MKTGFASVLLFIAICVAAIALFHFHGVTDVGYIPGLVTQSLFVWVKNRWLNDGPPRDDFPDGWVAPLISVWMLWRCRRELAAAQRETDWRGFALLLLALALHWAGMRTQQTRISFAAFILLTWAVPFHLFGWRTARILLPPVVFLFFSIDYNFLSAITLPMRIHAASIAATLLDGLGIASSSAAATIHFGGDRSMDLMTVAGGTRALQFAAMLAFVAAFVRPAGWLKSGLLIAASAPVCLIACGLAALVLGAAGVTTSARWFAAVNYAAMTAGIFLISRALERWRTVS